MAVEIKEMNDVERLKLLAEALNVPLTQIAKNCGIKSVQTLYDIKTSRISISDNVKTKLFAHYPINREWWETGVGHPLIDSNAENEKDKLQLYAIIENLQKQLEVKDQQINNLLSLLKKSEEPEENGI